MPELDLALMRQSGAILAATLKYLTTDFIQAGVSALAVAEKAEEIITSYTGATPAFKGYKGFPAAACVSVNTVVVHAIPLATVHLKPGDIVSVDCGVIYQGHYTDACRTVGVEEIPARTKKLLKITSESLEKGILAAQPGNRIGDISYAIQKHVERHRFRVSLDLVGHGIGRVLHGPPCVPNYGPPGTGELLEVGNCLAIEPVVFDGPIETFLHQDRWTVIARHNNLSAHFEDTVIISERGPEIITR